MDIYDLEVAIPYWSSIARQLGIHLVTAKRKKAELLKAGVIFYRRDKCKKRIVYHFPSRLKAWVGTKSAGGDIL